MCIWVVTSNIASDIEEASYQRIRDRLIYFCKVSSVVNFDKALKRSFVFKCVPHYIMREIIQYLESKEKARIRYYLIPVEDTLTNCRNSS